MSSRILLDLQWNITAQTAQWPLARPRMRRLLEASLGAQAEGAAITVRLVGTREGRSLNRDYRDKDYATNVLTFGYERHPVVVADLVLCLPVLVREARSQQKTLAAHFAHMPERYFRTFSASEIAGHVRLFRKFFAAQSKEGTSGVCPAVKWMHHPEQGHSEVLLCGWDHPGLIVRMCGAFLAARGPRARRTEPPA